MVLVTGQEERRFFEMRRIGGLLAFACAVPSTYTHLQMRKGHTHSTAFSLQARHDASVRGSGNQRKGRVVFCPVRVTEATKPRAGIPVLCRRCHTTTAVYIYRFRVSTGEISLYSWHCV